MGRSRILGAVAALCLAGCGTECPSPVGTWTVDRPQAERLAASWAEKEVAAAPAGEQDAARRRMQEMAAGMLKAELEATFAADQTARLVVQRDGEENVMEGTWAEAGDAIAVTPTASNGRPVPTREARRTIPFPCREGRLWFEVLVGLQVPLQRR